MEDKGKKAPKRLTPDEEIELRELMREIEEDQKEADKENRQRAERRKQEDEKRKKERARRNKIVQRAAAVAAVCAVVIAAGVALRGRGRKPVSENKSGENVSAVSVSSSSAAETASDDVTFCAAGDNLISQRILDQALEAAKQGNNEYDFTKLYEKTIPYIQKHDVSWIDVETCINDEITPAGYPDFSTPGEDGLALYKAGFNVYSLANNHTYDLLAEGVRAEEDFFANKMPSDITVTGLWRLLNEDSASSDGDAGTEAVTAGSGQDVQGVLSSQLFTSKYADEGLSEQPDIDYGNIPVFKCRNGHTIAFLTYAELSNSRDDAQDNYTMPQGSDARIIYLYERDLIRAQIKRADELADAVVVSCHWGDEDSHVVNDTQKGEAQFIADCGADLIIGDHPHVVQDAAWINSQDGRRVFCAYSLGNFVSTQEEPDNLIGVFLDCTFRFSSGDKKSEDGAEVTIENPEFVPVIMDYGTEGTDAHAVMLSDYTDQEASEHGINDLMSPGSFSLDYIRNVLEENISSDFLKL